MKASKIYDKFFTISRDSIIGVSSFTILIYIFGYIIFFASGYKYGVDTNLLRLNQNAKEIYSILTVSANLTVFFIFRFFLNKYLPKQIFLPIAKNSFFKWILCSTPLLLINFYYLSNAGDRLMAKEISYNIFIINFIYLSLAFHSWIILTCRNKFLILLSSLTVLFTSLITFEREPFLICFFALLLRMINTLKTKKLLISLVLLISFFISVFFTSKIISQVIYKDNVSDFSAIKEWSSKFGNPILKLSGELSHKLILENIYLSDNFRPNYDPKRIFMPIQIERFLFNNIQNPKTNGKIATESYSASTIINKFKGLGFSVFLDFYISFGFAALFFLPIFFMIVFRYVCLSKINFLMLVPLQVWFFKLMRSDLWPPFIPYLFLIFISILINFFVFKKSERKQINI
ncbi:MAG: hypothetical protein JJ840_07695 [Prochlorococcus marinus CUG1431]|uniref:Oligosaccharide repeat unit polymerase n=1 Tax=Prochlorococcus marinus CUG1433 TaxID=2774506 RepID=A0A9D9G163_PROMR|nr:hypothetical protein [Prochlorococcus marinus CUG1433]MBO6981229.1 hypothetical protein [Prochlorococcus marinus CUG1431]